MNTVYDIEASDADDVRQTLNPTALFIEADWVAETQPGSQPGSSGDGAVAGSSGEGVVATATLPGSSSCGVVATETEPGSSGYGVVATATETRPGSSGDGVVATATASPPGSSSDGVVVTATATLPGSSSDGVVATVALPGSSDDGVVATETLPGSSSVVATETPPGSSGDGVVASLSAAQLSLIQLRRDAALARRRRLVAQNSAPDEPATPVIDMPLVSADGDIGDISEPVGLVAVEPVTSEADAFSAQMLAAMEAASMM